MPNDVSERNGPTQVAGPRSVWGSGQNLPPLTGLASQISWANQIRSQVNASFDRVLSSIQAGINRYKSLEADETATLLDLVEEHRVKVLGVADAQYFLDHWQDPVDRVQRLIHADDRWKLIVEARAARNPRPEAIVPLRYLGFDDASGTRIFKFGRLPGGAGTPVFTVHAEVGLFLKHRISFQDGPVMCAAIVAAGETEDHLLTDEDCLTFVSLRPLKTDRKAPKRKPAIPPAA